jgi:hypothetical protein
MAATALAAALACPQLLASTTDTIVLRGHRQTVHL